MKKLSCDCSILHAEAVKAALRGAPPPELMKELSAFFKVMGDETRISILCLLEHTELCVCDLASALDMTKSAVSHQLAILKAHGLVRARREGREIFYAPEDAHVSAIYAMGLAHVRHKAEEEA